jgi:hypothetical protein
MNSIKSASPRLTIRKAATSAAAAASAAAPISNAALTAAVATSPVAVAAPRPIPTAMPVPPKRRSVSPDPTIDAYGRSKVVSRTPRVPEDATLNFITNFDIRYLQPGVGCGAGGENERTMSFTLLHDPTCNKYLIQMRVTGTYLTVHDPEFFTVRDLLNTFFRNKPLTLCNLPQDQLDTLIADLVQIPRSLNWSLRAY